MNLSPSPRADLHIPARVTTTVWGIFTGKGSCLTVTCFAVTVTCLPFTCLTVTCLTFSHLPHSYLPASQLVTCIIATYLYVCSDSYPTQCVSLGSPGPLPNIILTHILDKTSSVIVTAISVWEISPVLLSGPPPSLHLAPLPQSSECFLP